MTMITPTIRTNVSGAAAVYNAGMAQPKSADQVEVSYFFRPVQKIELTR